MAFEDLLDVAGAARRLGTTERHVRRLVYERKIPFTKVGGKLRFDPEALDAWVKQHTVKAAG